MVPIYTHGMKYIQALKLVSKPEETLILKEDGSTNADDPHAMSFIRITLSIGARG